LRAQYVLVRVRTQSVYVGYLWRRRGGREGGQKYKHAASHITHSALNQKVAKYIRNITMRLVLSATSFLLIELASGFVLVPSQNNVMHKSTALFAERADEPAPILFTDDLLYDMQQVLLKLDRRAKVGPGAVSLLEVDDFISMGQRIIVEMKQKEAGRMNVIASVAAAPAAVVTPPATAAPAAVDNSNDESPAYDGTGGMGLAKGTANTYIIDGMDEMSPEEYQKALQQTISDRQTARKESGRYGNRSTWDYFNYLNGETGILKPSEYEK
jgi:hypothetical protein